MRKYVAPDREFFRLPNNIFAVPMSPYEFRLYAYLVCCCGSRGYCWPTHEKIMQATGLKKTTLQKAISDLKRRQLISVRKHRNAYGYANNEYHLLPLDNPEIYRDLEEVTEELPMFVGDEISA